MHEDTANSDVATPQTELDTLGTVNQVEMDLTSRGSEPTQGYEPTPGSEPTVGPEPDRVRQAEIDATEPAPGQYPAEIEFYAIPQPVVTMAMSQRLLLPRPTSLLSGFSDYFGIMTVFKYVILKPVAVISCILAICNGQVLVVSVHNGQLRSSGWHGHYFIGQHHVDLWFSMDGTGRPSRRRLHEGCERCAFYVGTDEDDNFIELHVLAALSLNSNGSWERKAPTCS